MAKRSTERNSAPVIEDVLGIPLDVSDERLVDEAFGTIENQLGRISLLILNAAVLIAEPFEETTSETWRRLLSSFLYLTIGTGVSHTFVVNGTPCPGTRGNAIVVGARFGSTQRAAVGRAAPVLVASR